MAEYCISCGAPALMSYRGRRAIRGPLCGWCIREQILGDVPRPVTEPEISWRGDAVVIDLRETPQRALMSTEAAHALHNGTHNGTDNGIHNGTNDEDSPSESERAPVRRHPHPNRPLRAQT